ncbi:PrsW family intramembrane metalloprotease [Nocardia huaxiensis]|uniref:PrsW family intramembrane metalloprotease n=1 Tax=Nocardia huaxiensis TaxID=2755382 RepID=A0A7D6ZPJ9_9NOCA|nr:PrsW family intramembrane metalloprotease [Nocardia huaxiensis]QLY30525.1 PrsW family intramembrane metalloprotease [Nocardia huaxiensis]UFS95874.1 PrsW family intramembrane metalloprotease [Nocardia huaxiensis]
MSGFRAGSALFWVYWAMLIIGPIALLAQLASTLSLTLGDVIVGMPITLLTLLVFGGLLVYLDRLRARTTIRVPLFLGFLWGALVGPGIAIYANDDNMRAIQNLAGDAFANNWAAPISASIVEEGIKGLGVFVVAWLARPLLYRPMHGLLLGGFTGLGFQVTEDITYNANAALQSAQGGPGPAIIVSLVRFAVGVTSHWMFTALAGIGIVLAIARKDWSAGKRFGVFAGCYLLGAAMHFAWDAPSPEGFDTFGIGGKMAIYIAVFLLVYFRVLRSERSWFREMAKTVAAQGVAPIEELNTLVTRRSRRHTRASVIHQGGPPNRWLKQRQRQLIEVVQRAGAPNIALPHAYGQWAPPVPGH